MSLPEQIATSVLLFCCGFPTDTDVNVETARSLPKSQVAMSVVGSFLFCLFVGGSITVSLVLWVKYAKRSRRGQRIARLSISKFAVKYNEVSLLSSRPVKVHRFEFPRSSLELLNILGRFFILCITLLSLSCQMHIMIYRRRAFWESVQG